MPDRSFQNAVLFLAAAKRKPSGAASKSIFDHYVSTSQSMRDALVLALIADVLTGAARSRATPPAPATEAA